ncbi:MAG: shikimate dehydrogenase [archaeon]
MKLCVIGDPVEHSLSPAMHNAALRELGLEHTYEKIRVKPEELKKFIERIRSGEISGASITIPHKQSILPLMDGLSKEAELIGAVNTVQRKENKLVGHNTDGIGCVNALEEAGVEVSGKSALILGAGGAARAIAFTLALSGAEALEIANRTPEKAEALARDVNEETGLEVAAGDLSNLGSKIRNVDILINTTSVGMKGTQEDKTLVKAVDMHPGLVVNDIVYTPRKTLLLKEAGKAGCKIVEGRGMLVHQGAEQFRIFTGKDAPVEVMREALNEALGEKN